MWKLKSNERLIRWRDFRRSLGQLSLEDALQATWDLWSTVPFAPYYLDPDSPEKWPNPWDLITENYYCDLAKALGIVYTIFFSANGKNLDVEIRIYHDPETGYMYNLAVFEQGKYVINFAGEDIVNIQSVDDKLKLKYVYGKKKLKLEEY